ncbi:MAG: lipoyl synthase [Dehalococcoidia bacterium]|nr:lipoyl synthase [Dehalococcoidia bacterium]
MTTPAVQSRKPEWLKVRMPGGGEYARLKNLVREEQLHTVCEEAHCPNIGECWSYGTATFMILGDVCTRSCGFCAVTSGRPEGLDLFEPVRLARTVEKMGLRYVVITSVNRDDLADGGASVFARCIKRIHQLDAGIDVEVLIPDLMGNWEALAVIIESSPRVLNHNIETVPRLYSRVRPKAVYERSLRLFREARRIDPEITTKSGIMLGLGEERDEVLRVFRDLRDSGVNILTVGQYLRPSEKHIEMVRYVAPQEFADFKAEAVAMGFSHVEAGPLVRSSYHAREHVGPQTTDREVAAWRA